MTNVMSPTWRDICCASISVQDLPILADLRRRPEIRVSMVGDRAWICWDPEPEALRRILVERLLPLSGVEVFARRGGHWYRPGEHLPAFGLPIGEGNAGLPLKNVLFPRPMTVASSTSRETTTLLTLRLVRDPRNQHRPARAVTCRLEALAIWADRETTLRITALSGAWIADPDGGSGRCEVLVLGEPGTLSTSMGGTRFWGTDVLIPLGFRPEPDLPEPTLRRLVGAGTDDLVLLDFEGYERIPREVIRPLTRAGIRLARAAATAERSRGEGRP
jgi:MoxR-vWA-beta-propeller ternary system domain bpX2